MNVIVCIDNHLGMMFNNRRQSKDEVVVEKIKEIVGSKKLYTNKFSSKLFGDFCTTVQDSLLFSMLNSENEEKEESYCFVENIDIAPYFNKIGSLYIFKWNRDYPYDCLLKDGYRNIFHLLSREDFKGKSHDNITLEIWKR